MTTNGINGVSPGIAAHAAGLFSAPATVIGDRVVQGPEKSTGIVVFRPHPTETARDYDERAIACMEKAMLGNIEADVQALADKGVALRVVVQRVGAGPYQSVPGEAGLSPKYQTPAAVAAYRVTIQGGAEDIQHAAEAMTSLDGNDSVITWWGDGPAIPKRPSDCACAPKRAARFR